MDKNELAKIITDVIFGNFSTVKASYEEDDKNGLVDKVIAVVDSIDNIDTNELSTIITEVVWSDFDAIEVLYVSDDKEGLEDEIYEVLENMD